MKRFSLLWVSILCTAFVRADDAAWMQVGDAGNFTHNKQIRMVEEEVRITLFNSHMRVHAWFKFRNEGPATTVTMAFPDGIRDYKPRTKNAPRAIRWFKSAVDGRSVRVTRQQYRSFKGNDFEVYTHVWIKKVPFKEDQTRMVTVAYEANHGDIGDFIEDVYTLQTGATWKGPIGKAVLFIDWSHLRGQMDPTISTAVMPLYSGQSANPKMIAPRIAKLEYTNFEPKFDIAMDWAPTFWNFFINGRRVDGAPVDDDRATFIDGGGADPQIYAESIQNLLLKGVDAERAYDHETEIVNFEFKGKDIRVAKGRIYVDNKPVRLRRGYEKDRGYGTWIYVRDLVSLLGGSYRYDSKLDRVQIRF